MKTAMHLALRLRLLLLSLLHLSLTLLHLSLSLLFLLSLQGFKLLRSQRLRKLLLARFKQLLRFLWRGIAGLLHLRCLLQVIAVDFVDFRLAIISKFQ